MVSKTALIAVVVAAVVVVGAVGAYLILSDDDDAAAEMTFLVQDDEGVYFWIKGSGDDAKSAFSNAMDKYSFDFKEKYDSDGNVESLYGITASGDSKWNVLYWTDNAWKADSASMSGVSADKYDYCVVIYAKSAEAASNVKPATTDAVVLDPSTSSGIRFFIESPSGIYFLMSGTGTNALTAFKALCTTYKIPFVPSKSGNDETGVDSLFGLVMGSKYWTQSTFSDGTWATNALGMTNLKESDFTGKYFGLAYDYYGGAPKNTPTGGTMYSLTFNCIGSQYGAFYETDGYSYDAVGSIASGNALTFNVTTASVDEISGQVLIVKCKIGDGTETTLEPTATAGDKRTFKTANITADTVITMEFSGVVNKIYDIVDYVVPAAGEEPTPISEMGFAIETVGYTWYDAVWTKQVQWTDDSGNVLGENDTFSSGETYHLIVIYTPGASLTFVDGTTVYGGSVPGISLSNVAVDGTMTLTYTFVVA